MNPSSEINPREAAFEASKKQGRKGKTWHPIRITLLAFAGIALFGVGLLGFQITEISGKVFQNQEKTNFFSQLTQVVTSRTTDLDGYDRDRINILLLGIGGGDHDGPNLSDTNILLSIKPSTEEVSMVSIPRDTYVSIPGYGSNRINAAHAFGEDYEGRGPELASEVMTLVTGEPIDYYVRIDFEGFRQAIDALGGVDINVPVGFYDFNKNLTYTQGWEHMNGERALGYARARYVEGHEGSDFARAARQQLVIKAMRDNILASNSITDLVNVGQAMEALGSHVKTNLNPGEIIALYKLTKDLDTNDIINVVVDYEKTGLLYGTSVNMGGLQASVLMPTAGNFSEIQNLVQNVFSMDLLTTENATIEVQNGSNAVGIATIAAEDIPMDVISVTNAASKDYTETLIIDFSGGIYPHALNYLESKFGVEAVNSDSLDIPRQSYADIVVIVGSNYASEIYSE